MLALSESGRLLLTGSSSPDAKAILWDVDPSGSVSPRVRFRLRGHDQAVTAFAISPAGDRIFTADRIGLGILWDASSGRQIGERFELLRGFRINAARFSTDGKRLLIASDDQQLTILDVESRKRVGRLKHDGFVTQVSLSDDGRSALTVSELRTQDGLQSQATLWNLATEAGQVLDRVNSTTSGAADNTRAVRSANQFGTIWPTKSLGDRQPHGGWREWPSQTFCDGRCTGQAAEAKNVPAAQRTWRGGNRDANLQPKDVDAQRRCRIFMGSPVDGSRQELSRSRRRDRRQFFV